MGEGAWAAKGVDLREVVETRIFCRRERVRKPVLKCSGMSKKRAWIPRSEIQARREGLSGSAGRCGKSLRRM